MKNGNVNSVTVETGLISDTQTEIISGINEGDEIVTGSSAANTTSTQTRSVFSGNAFRVGGR
jgi:hypothetical protein